MITLVIDGMPIVLQRHRMCRGKAYDPQVKEKEQIRWQLRSQFNQKPLSGPLAVSVTFHFVPPKNTSYVKKKQMLHGKIHRIERPDLSNLIKWVEDCGNGLLWEDDAQIFAITSRKIYGERPQTLIQIMHADENMSANYM